MSTLVNINPAVQDVHYRYKRPQIQVKFEQAHGASTRITNLPQVAAALVINLSKKSKAAETMKTQILKALQRQMGVMAILDAGTQNPIFKGHIAASRFEVELNKWVTKNILCPKCSSPEYVAKTGCPACGHAAESKKTVTEVTKMYGYIVEAVDRDDNKIALEQCDRLHKLYALRPNLVVDKAIDQIWKCDDATWTMKLRSRVDELIKEIAQHNTTILCTEDVSKRLKNFLSQASQISVVPLLKPGDYYLQFVDFPHVTCGWGETAQLAQQALLETLDQVLDIATKDGRNLHVPRGFPFKQSDKVTMA